MLFPARSTAYHMARVHGEEMFKGLKQAFADHMSGEAAKLKVLRDDEYLAALRRVWERHKVALPLVRDVLLFMVTLRVCARAPRGGR